MKKLKDFGIYVLPGIERRLYLVPAGNSTYFLYDCEFGSRLPPRFQISENGKIANWFDDLPVWSVEDLVETGENHLK